ncbi:Drug/metabolite transporter [Artemisia annua]|uniref:Drug/metabolite transporter n=1 Tax=Artemisia annua TaxID=35608 RepID=A0A2U1N8Z3_ARTAN|nr:Drug/metabolite transporter [Artemisia annua]
MCNVLPAITCVTAFILRLEMVNLKSIRSQAKVTGTNTTVGGAMLMTLVKGPMLELFWTKGRTNINDVNNGEDLSHSIKVELSLTAWICLLGTDEGAIVALVTEKGYSTTKANNGKECEENNYHKVITIKPSENGVGETLL